MELDRWRISQVSVEDHRATLQFYNGAAQFSVTSLVAVAVVQFSILLLLEGKAKPIDPASFVSLYLSLSIAYVAVVILGAYLIYNYLLFAHLLEYIRELPALREIREIDNNSRRAVREFASLRNRRRSILMAYWSKIVLPIIYAVISFWLPFSVWYLRV